MQEYTVIKKGLSIQHCIEIPEEFTDLELEIRIRPLHPRGSLQSTLERLFKENEDVNPFEMIQNPLEWQREIRDEWE